MARRNLCQNPACTVDITGWIGSATPPARVTGLTGFPTTTGARLDNGSNLRTQTGAVVAGTAYTLSCHVRPEVVTRSGPFYIEWTNGVGGKTYTASAYSAPTGAVTRISITDTAPVGAVTAALLLEGGSYAFNPTVVTAALIEAGAVLDTYFDGDTPGPPTSTWDGTPGLSTSTYSDAPPGTPAPEWTAGQPRTAWRAGNLRTSWSAGNPYTAWTADNVRTGG